eukprot:914774-Pelagomonas_calceolata.AAC.1
MEGGHWQEQGGGSEGGKQFVGVSKWARSHVPRARVWAEAQVLRSGTIISQGHSHVHTGDTCTP